MIVPTSILSVTRMYKRDRVVNQRFIEIYRLLGRYAPFESYINLLKPILEGKFSKDYDEFYVALSATYWILKGKFEIIPDSVDFGIVEETFNTLFNIINSEES
jgi:hypothetical protein